MQECIKGKRKTHDIQAARLHSPRHVFSFQKREKEESVRRARRVDTALIAQ